MPVDRTRLTSRMLDRKRARLKLGNIKLQFFEKLTGTPTLLAEIEDGWCPSDERIRGQIESLFKIEVGDQLILTADIAKRANRLQWGANYCSKESYDPPQGEARVWTFFSKEVKTGAIK